MMHNIHIHTPTDFAQHYVKGKVIGSGSFGVVHLGIDLHTGQEVAVKVRATVDVVPLALVLLWVV